MKISKLLASDEIKDPDLQLKITAFMSADVVVSFIPSLLYPIVFVHYFIPFVSVSAKYQNQVEADFDFEL